MEGKIYLFVALSLLPVCIRVMLNAELDKISLLRATPPRYLSLKEAAALACMCQRSILRAINEGKLRALKPTRRYIIRLADLERWLEGDVDGH